MPKNLSAKTYDGQYDVRAYGAKGDNSTDDTAAIQAALTAAYTAGGGVVRIPPGTYLNSATWIIKENVHIRCDIGVTLKRTVDAFGYLLQNGDDDDDKTVYTGHSNISVHGGIWDMQGATLTTGAAAFAFGHAQNIEFQNVTIKDVPTNHAMDLTALKGVRIKNCRFTGFRLGGGDATTLEAIQIDLAKAGSFPPFGADDDTPCLDVVIEGCYFGTSGTGGTTSWPRAIGGHTGVDGNNHMDIVIRDNKFDGLTDNAVPLFAFERVVVSGNTFVGCAAGVVASSMSSQDMRNINISNNNFYNMGTAQASITIDPGSSAFAYNVTVANNNIDTSGTATAAKGINLWDCINATVTDNVITAVGDTGIRVSSCSNVIVSGNTVGAPKGHGIQISGGTDIVVTNNQVKGASRLTDNLYYGIAFDSTCVGFTVSRNRVRKYGDAGNEVAKGLFINSNCSGGAVLNNDIQDTGMTNSGTTPASGLMAGPPTILLVRTTTQPIADTTDTAVSWSSATKNTGPASWWSSGANIVFPWAGLYHISAYLTWASDADGYRAMNLNRTTTLSVNNFIMGDISQSEGNLQQGRRLSFSGVINEATAGTTYVLDVWHSAGNSLNIDKIHAGQPAMAWIALTYLGNAT